jgi:hypothetical protein
LKIREIENAKEIFNTEEIIISLQELIQEVGSEDCSNLYK